MKFSRHLLKYSYSLVFAGLWLAAPSASALTIQGAIKDMLSNNPEVQVARQEVLAREGEVKGAKAGYLPTLDAEAGVGREWTQSPSTGREEIRLTRHELALRLRQTIYDGSATNSEVARQQARYRSALFSVEDTQENAALRSAQAYINVLRQAKLLALLKDSLDEHQNIYDQMSLRREAGVGSRADVDQITVRLSLATSNYIAGKNNYLNALAQFQGIVGYIPEVSEMEEVQLLAVPPSLEHALKQALDSHPAIKSVMADIEAAEAQHKAAASGFKPRVSLEGDRTWNKNIDGLEGDNEDWVLALRLRYNLYNGGADSARRQQTAELLGQAKDALRETRWETEEGMRLSWYAYEATQQQLNHLQRHVTSVTDTKKAYVKQFKIGRRTLLDLLNTEGELLQAKQTLVNTKYDHLYSQVRVLNSSGQLTRSLGIE